MVKSVEPVTFLEGSGGSLPLREEDKAARKFAMLIEGTCMGLGPTKAASKYGYSKQRYFQLLHAYQEEGLSVLIDEKRGPKRNYIRTETVVNQIIRHRFLDPDASTSVIVQKMQQTGIKISQRSVERTITEMGLQKKTPFAQSQKRSETC